MQDTFNSIQPLTEISTRALEAFKLAKGITPQKQKLHVFFPEGSTAPEKDKSKTTAKKNTKKSKWKNQNIKIRIPGAEQSEE